MFAHFNINTIRKSLNYEMSKLDTLNPIYTCGFHIETLNHFFSHYRLAKQGSFSKMLEMCNDAVSVIR